MALWLLLIAFLPGFLAEEAGIRFRVTDKGLDYLNGIAAVYATNQIRSAQIPNMSLPIVNSAGKGYANVSQSKIYGFGELRLRHQLSPSNHLTWTATVSSLKVWGSWLLRFKSLWPVKGGGHYTVNATQIQVLLEMTIDTTPKGQLLLRSENCQLDFGHFDLDLKGSLMAYMANLVAEKLEGRLKEQLRNRVCGAFESALLKANGAIKTQIIDIAPQLSIDNRLVASPIVHTAYLELETKGQIAWDRQWKTPLKPKSFRPVSSGQKKMLYLWLSDFVFNSFLYSRYSENKTVFQLSRDLQPHLSDYLATTCDTFCFGLISPDFPTRFPDSHVNLLVQIVRAPEVNINPSGASLTCGLGIKAFLPATGPSPVLSLVVHFHLDLNPRLNGSRLFTDFNLKMLKAVVKQSSLVQVNQQQVDDILAEIVTPVLDVVLAEINEKGLALPIPSRIQLTNADIRLLDNTVEIGTDLQLTPQ